MEVEELKEVIDLIFDRLNDSDPEVRRSAAFHLKKTVRESTGTVTSIPQAIKYLRERIPDLHRVQSDFKEEDAGREVADVLAIVSLTYPSEKGYNDASVEPIEFVLAGTTYSILMWGLEFQRMMTSIVANTYAESTGSSSSSIEEPTLKYNVDDMRRIIVLSVDSLMANGFVQDAVDVLFDAGLLSELIGNYAIPEDDDRISVELREQREANAKERLRAVREYEHIVKHSTKTEEESTASEDSEDKTADIGAAKEEKEEHYALQSNVLKMAHYLTESALVVPPKESFNLFKIVYTFLVENEEYLDALRIGLRLREYPMIHEVLQIMINKFSNSEEDCGFIVQAFVDMVNTDRIHAIQAYEDLILHADCKSINIIQDVISQKIFGTLHSYALAQYDNADPLKVEEIMKLHVEDIKFTSTVLGSSLLRKADLVASGFANAAGATDTLISVEKSAVLSEKRSHKPEDIQLGAFMHGALNLWTGVSGANVVAGLLNNKESKDVQVGGIAALGACFSNTHDSANPVLAMVTPYCVNRKKYDHEYRIAAITALAMAYGGTRNEAVTSLLQGLMLRPESIGTGTEVGSNKTTVRAAKNEYMVVCHAALALGLVWAGSLSEDIMYSVVEAIQSWEENFVIRVSHTRMMLCAIGCLMTGRGAEGDAFLQTIKEMELFPDTMMPFLVAISSGYSFISSNDVSTVNDLLNQISETHTMKVKVKEELAAKDVLSGKNEETDEADEKRESDERQKLLKEVAASGGEPDDILSLASMASVASDQAARHGEKAKFETVEPLCDEAAAIISIALISNTDDTGIQVTRRILDRCLQFGETPLKRGCPWAYAALCPSNPSVAVMEAIERLTVADDLPTSCGALMSLGLVGFGSSNSRLISSLRKHIAKFSYLSSHVSCAEMAMGMLFAGRSSARLRTAHSEGFVPSTINAAAYASFLFSMSNDWNLIMPLSSAPLTGSQVSQIYSTVEPSLMPWSLLLMTMESRASVAINTNGTPISMKVRVGNPEEGSRSGVTGAQTAKTPAMVSPDERIVAIEGLWKPFGRILDNVLVCKESNTESKEVIEGAK